MWAEYTPGESTARVLGDEERHLPDHRQDPLDISGPGCFWAIPLFMGGTTYPAVTSPDLTKRISSRSVGSKRGWVD